MIHLRVTPFLIGVLATAGCLAVPAVAWASGGGHGGSHDGGPAGGRAAAGPARAQGAAPAGGASVHGAVTGHEQPAVNRHLAARARMVRRGPSLVIWPPGYPYPYPEPAQVNGAGDQFANPSPPIGWLELRLEPGTAQVYVDGYYAGEVSDFDRPGGRTVEPGSHHIEIRASGYQTSAFDVRLLPDQPVTYREDLRPVTGSEPPRRAAAGSGAASGTTFYIIAGCYMGNVPPTQVVLRPGCDPDQVKTVDIRH
jgi:hypothetical protein